MPSPQSIEIDETIPSGSPAENDTVTDWPVMAGLGETLANTTAGGLSLIVAAPVTEAVKPLLSVTIIVIVKVSELALPVLM